MGDCHCQALIERLNCEQNMSSTIKLVGICAFLSNYEKCELPLSHTRHDNEFNKLVSMFNASVWAGGYMYTATTVYELIPPHMRFLIPLTAVSAYVVPKFGQTIKSYGEHVFNSGRSFINNLPFQIKRKDQVITEETPGKVKLDTDTINALIAFLNKKE